MPDEEEKKHPPPPAGIMCVDLNGKQMIQYELKKLDAEGKPLPGLKDVVSFKMFDKETCMKEIQDIGFYSGFYDLRDVLPSYPDDQLLLYSDVDEQYGSNFLACVTVKGKNDYLKVLQAAADEEQAAKRRIEEEIARKKAEEEAYMNAVYEDKPMLSKPYKSDSIKVTNDEVDRLSVKTGRPLLELSMVRKYGEFGDNIKFTDKADPPGAECRQHKDPNYDLKKMELDVALQAVPQITDTGTQTTWFRSVNKTLQSDAIGMSEDEKQAHMEDPNLLAFLQKVQYDVQEALQSNETVNLFKDEFKELGDEDIDIGNKNGNSIKELRSFADLKYSKNKVLPCVDFHPRKKGVVAVAAVNNLTFDQRVQVSGKVSTSFLLIWNFTDLIHPQLMLESPHDTYTFQFNPSAPHIIAAGCISGQVIMWDMTDAQEQLQRIQNKKVGEQDDDEGASDKVAPIRHAAISHIDTSHRRPVADLTWLPPGMEVDHFGKITRTEETKSCQFLTVAGDGQVCIWDTRYKEIAKKNPRLHKDLKPNKDGTMPEIPWQPQFKLTLTKLEGVGELNLSRINLMCHEGGQQNPDPEKFSSQFYCATEEGDMVFADWKPEAIDSGGGDEGEEDGETSAENVQWMSQDHFRPCVSLERSPFFPDIILSVSDWSFNLWQAGTKTPLFSSPLSSAYLTCGRWSPTRPGVLMVAKADGSIDVWDFTDQSYRPSATVNIAPSAITSMQFWINHNSTKQQLLAAGDVSGNLHMLDIPMNLWRALGNEKTMMEAFFAREKVHVDYVTERTVVRDAELEVVQAQEEEAGGEEEEEEKKPDLKALAEEDKASEEAYKAMEHEFELALGLAKEANSDDDDMDA
jgi:WD40 repeat protein